MSVRSTARAPSVTEVALSAKNSSLVSLLAFFLAAVVAWSAPARAQERTEDPSDSLSPTGRTETPTGPGPKERAKDTGGWTEKPAADPKGTAAPWSWPWGGAVHSPTWTQDENWVSTRVWLMDVGHVQLEAVYEGTLARRSYDLDNFMKAKARIGLLPHIELGISENLTFLKDDHVRQEGNEISARIALWDYGTIPLNPAFEIVWHPRHKRADAYEARGLIGFELFPGLFLAGNAFFLGETGGNHDYVWGFRGGVAYDLIHDVLRVGCEGGVSFHWNKDHDDTPFRDTAPTLGPTLLFRPLALIKPEWGHWAKLTTSAEFGVRDDDKEVPFMRAGVILAAAF